MSHMQEEILYTPEELAQKLKLSKYTVYEMIKRGDIQAHHIGRSIRVSESQLELYFMSTKKAENLYEVEIIQELDDQYAYVNGVKIYVTTDLVGKAKIFIRPEDIILSVGPITSSARNVLKGKIVHIISDEKSAIIKLDTGFQMSVFITNRSLQEMKLNRGDEIYAIFKSMAVKVMK